MQAVPRPLYDVRGWALAGAKSPSSGRVVHLDAREREMQDADRRNVATVGAARGKENNAFA